MLQDERYCFRNSLMETKQTEKQRLQELQDNFSSHDGFNAQLIDMRFRSLKEWVDPKSSCLELGSADGRMTERLLEHAPDLTAVDGSPAYCERLEEKFPELEVVCSLFEEFLPEKKYQTIILGHVLEHVEDPVAILRHVCDHLLAPGGTAIISVPNANSMHRQVGVVMGLLEKTTDLNEADLRIGHRRVYTFETLTNDIVEAGLLVEAKQGVFLKPVSNYQIESDWSDELIEAYYQLGKQYNELCADLMVVARKQSE